MFADEEVPGGDRAASNSEAPNWITRSPVSRGSRSSATCRSFSGSRSPPSKRPREGGDVVRVDRASQRYYLLSNPDHVRHVLQDNNKNHVKGYGNAHLRVSTA